MLDRQAGAVTFAQASLKGIQSILPLRVYVSLQTPIAQAALYFLKQQVRKANLMFEGSFPRHVLIVVKRSWKRSVASQKQIAYFSANDA